MTNVTASIEVANAARGLVALRSQTRREAQQSLAGLTLENSAAASSYAIRLLNRNKACVRAIFLLLPVCALVFLTAFFLPNQHGISRKESEGLCGFLLLTPSVVYLAAIYALCLVFYHARTFVASTITILDNTALIAVIDSVSNPDSSLCSLFFWNLAYLPAEFRLVLPSDQINKVHKWLFGGDQSLTVAILTVLPKISGEASISVVEKLLSQRVSEDVRAAGSHCLAVLRGDELSSWPPSPLQKPE